MKTKQKNLLLLLTLFFLIPLFSHPVHAQDTQEKKFAYISQLNLGVMCADGFTLTEGKDADGKNDPLFTLEKYPLRSELYYSSAKEDYSLDITDLKTASDEQINGLIESLVEATHQAGATVTQEAVVEQKTVNDVPYIVLRYNVSAYGTKIVSLDYSTVINGNVITFCNYAIDAGSDEKNQAYFDTFDQLMGNLFYGSEKDAKLVAESIMNSSSQDASQNSGSAVLDKINAVSIPTWIWIAVPALILILFAKFKRPSDWHEDFMSLGVSKGILGLCALLIVLHHISQSLSDNAGALIILENVGVGFVGLFFIFSGYGLFKSLKSKEGYLKGYFKKRYVAILVPFFLINTIFFLYTWLIMKEPMTAKDVICYLTGFILINTHMWYIIEIALFYLLFYLIFRFVKNDLAGLLLMTGFVAVFTVVSLTLCHGPYWFQGEWWFNTSLTFVVGMFLAKYEKPVIAFARKWYLLLLPVCLAALCGLYMATSYMLENYSYYTEYLYGDASASYKDKFLCLAPQLPMVIIFTFTVLLITMKLQFKNRILDFLGRISLELYLIHNLFIMIFTQVIPVTSPFMFTTLVVAASIPAAALLHFITAFLIKTLKK